MTQEVRIANYNIYSWQEGGPECLCNISRKVKGPADQHGAEAKCCERHCVKNFRNPSREAKHQ